MENHPDWTVVLIDDEEDIREVTTIVLRDEGFSVFAAQDGEQGLALCKTHQPQIVITDIRMPGMDGIQVLQQVKERFEDTQVIVVTAFGEMGLAVRALQLDASDFINKPIDQAVLMVALDRAKSRFIARKALKDYTRFLEEEKARTARELMDTYAFQKNLIEHSMDGILACDSQGNIKIFNAQMEKILNCSKSHALGSLAFSSLFAPGDDLALKAAMAGPKFGGKDRLFLYETAMQQPGGKKIPVQVSAAMLRENKAPSSWVCFIRDLRQIRKLERDLADQASVLHQDKMMSLGRLSASVVHEINNPLFGVLNYVRLMARILAKGTLSPPTLDKFRQYLDLVEQETQRCSTIISSLLTFSRKSEERFDDLDINDLVDRSILLSQHKMALLQIRLATRIQPALPRVKGDGNQLQQCLINLIFNAMDAMPRGGTLTLSCCHDPGKNQIRIGIEDTGTGISDQDRPHIFEPFFTTKQEGHGVGLGLSTVYGIVRRHQGEILVESRPGRTLFTLCLPVKDAS